MNALIKFGPHKYELFPPQLIGNKRNLIVKSLISGKTNEQDVEEFNKYVISLRKNKAITKTITSIATITLKEEI